jgi:hypothetical protein
MTSISPVAASPAPAAVTSNTSTSLAAIATPKPVAAATPTAAARPAKPVAATPAATVDLSQQALAMIKGDKDWKPGQKIDSY